jgi:single-stranded DNA-binding protein
MTLTNSCRIIGYCASDPISTQTRFGKPMAKVAVYTKDFIKNNKRIILTEAKRKDCHHWCIFFGKNAERAKRLLMKGSQIHVSGTLRYVHKTHAGKNFYIAQIWVDEFMLSSKAIMTKELYDRIFNDNGGNENES